MLPGNRPLINPGHYSSCHRQLLTLGHISNNELQSEACDTTFFLGSNWCHKRKGTSTLKNSPTPSYALCEGATYLYSFKTVSPSRNKEIMVPTPQCLKELDCPWKHSTDNPIIIFKSKWKKKKKNLKCFSHLQDFWQSHNFFMTNVLPLENFWIEKKDKKTRTYFIVTFVFDKFHRNLY